MSTLLVRDLDPAVKEALARQAKIAGRSMEAEARRILSEGVNRPNIGLAFYELGQKLGGAEDLPVPPREDEARAADLS